MFSIQRKLIQTQEAQILHTSLIGIRKHHFSADYHLVSQKEKVQSLQIHFPLLKLDKTSWFNKKPNKFLSFVGNLNSANDLTHRYGFVLAIERLYGIDHLIPESVNLIRTLILELERVMSHLDWLSDFLTFCGLTFLKNRCLRIRQNLNSFTQTVSGVSMKHLSKAFKVGKLGIEFNYDVLPQTLKDIQKIQFQFHQLFKGLIHDALLQKFLIGVGILNKEQTEKTCAVGPVARASGVLRDIRIGEPYGSYLNMPLKIIFSYSQDLWGIFKVRLQEINESLRIITILLGQEFILTQQLDLNDIDAQQEGQMTVRIETPRGLGLYSIECGLNMDVKGYSIINPSMMNLASLKERVKGVPISHITRIIQAYDQDFVPNQFFGGL